MATEIKDIKEIAKLAEKTKTIYFEVDGDDYKMDIKRMSADTHLKADELIDFEPPMKMDPLSGQKEKDFNDPAFKEKWEKASRERNAFIIEHGSSLQLPGENFLGKSDYLYQNLPIGAIDFICKAVTDFSRKFDETKKG